jgi:hypothetical protein
MKGTDRFLIAIVAGAVLLVGVVLALALLRTNQPGYQPDDTPEGVAHNYLLALQLEDYERAYGYLSPTLPGYPADVGTFEHNLLLSHWGFFSPFEDVSLAVESVKVSGDGARVVVRRTEFYRFGLFDSGQHSTAFDMTLHREQSAWRVTDSERYYWASCWRSFKGCQ